MCTVLDMVAPHVLTAAAHCDRSHCYAPAAAKKPALGCQVCHAEPSEDQRMYVTKYKFKVQVLLIAWAAGTGSMRAVVSSRSAIVVGRTRSDIRPYRFGCCEGCFGMVQPGTD